MTPSPADPARRRTLMLTLGLGGLVVLLLAAVALGYWWGQRAQSVAPPSGRATSPVAPAPVTTPVTANPGTLAPPVTTAIAGPALAPVPVSPPAAATGPALPSDPASAQEELDRQHDEQARLQSQKQLLAAQVQGSQQLIDLKARQIAALEQQLAEPEPQ